MGEAGDLDQVVGQDAPSAPDPCAFESAVAGSFPTVLPFQGGYAPFGTGAPLDQLDEPVLGLGVAARSAGLTFAGDRHQVDTEVFELGVDRCEAVTAVCCDSIGSCSCLLYTSRCV